MNKSAYRAGDRLHYAPRASFSCAEVRFLSLAIVTHSAAPHGRNYTAFGLFAHGNAEDAE
jgi:hypothetical protein